MAEKYILAINPGSTSTKVGVFKNDVAVCEETIRHTTSELAGYRRPVEEKGIRLKHIAGFLRKSGIPQQNFAAVVGRGGIIAPMRSGTYRINQKMLEDLSGGAAASHASALGGIIAAEIAVSMAPPVPAFVVDPVVVDEMAPIARLSGIPHIQRSSVFHALNTKAIAKQFAHDSGKKYEECELVVAHLGGGISVGAHRGGMVIDVNNGITGEGPFSPERSGGLPLAAVIEMCFSGRYTEKEMLDFTSKTGGLMAYLGQNDLREVEKQMESGDAQAKLVVDAMAYQVGKEVGAMMAVLNGKADAILLTGGLAYSEYFTSAIIGYVGAMAPVHIYPGEDELKALAMGALRVLNGQETEMEYVG